MSDSLGNGEGNSTDEQARLYERWAEGGSALSLIGDWVKNPARPLATSAANIQELIETALSWGAPERFKAAWTFVVV